MSIVITIDGPSAAGKGTLAREISQEYGLPYLDTGKLYRGVAARILATGENPVAAAVDLKEADLHRPGLRTNKVSQAASTVSAIPEVRKALDIFQKTFAAQPPRAVIDGRDIGVAIAPHAQVKIS